jgi:hypothetical protein
MRHVAPDPFGKKCGFAEQRLDKYRLDKQLLDELRLDRLR